MSVIELSPYGFPCSNELLQPRLRYCPYEPTPKQQLFCMLNTFEAFYGGAAGGSKSWALLMAALMFVDVPGYSAILIRNTYQDLSLPGALMDVAHDWLDDTDAQWGSQDKRWTFPSGATLTFGYLDGPRDHLRYKGAAFQYCGIDEMSEIREEQAMYMMSRIRRPSSGIKGSAPDGLSLDQVPLRFRGSSNPGGLYPRYVYDRYINKESKKEGAVFIPAKLEDNPHLDTAAYEMALQQMGNSIIFEQLRHGVWDINPEGAMFNRDAIDLVDQPFHGDGIERLRFWDIAGTKRSHANPDPDRTAGWLLARDSATGLYRLEDLQWFAEEPAETEKRIQRTAELDGKGVKIAIEAIGVGKVFYDQFVRHVLRGYQVERHSFQGAKNTDKESRARLVASAWNNNLFSIVVKANTREALDEINSFGAKGYKGHDDVVDSLSGAFNHMNLKKKAEFARPTGSL